MPQPSRRATPSSHLVARLVTLDNGMPTRRFASDESRGVWRATGWARNLCSSVMCHEDSAARRRSPKPSSAPCSLVAEMSDGIVPISTFIEGYEHAAQRFYDVMNREIRLPPSFLCSTRSVGLT